MADGDSDVQCRHLRLTLAPIPEPRRDEEVLVEDCNDDEEDEQGAWTTVSRKSGSGDQATWRSEVTQGRTPAMTGVRSGSQRASRPTTNSQDERTPETRGNLINGAYSDPSGGRRMGHFWALNEDSEDDDEESKTPSTEDFTAAASRIGGTVEELIEAEVELHELGKVS
jgi:hypothetical protein